VWNKNDGEMSMEQRETVPKSAARVAGTIEERNVQRRKKTIVKKDISCRLFTLNLRDIPPKSPNFHLKQYHIGYLSNN